jgi:radical SAM protein with 4Fe4S-binding SPASM domain
MTSLAQHLTHGLSAGKKLLAPGAQKPIYLLNFVTNRCNAACDHCFYWEELNTNVRSELTVEEHQRIARSLGAMFQVTFTGGSPELRKDLPELVYEYHRHCLPAHMTFCMLGYSTDMIVSHVTKMLERCNGQKITIGISLDGIGDEHDEYRKLPGLFDRVVKTVHGLAAVRARFPNLRVAIGMTVHGLNRHKVEHTAAWARQNLPIDILKPILVRGNPLNPETRHEDSMQDCIDKYDRITDFDREWLIAKGMSKFTAMDYVINAKENVQRNLIKHISQTGDSPVTCSGARETAVLYPNGNIAGCEMRENVLGNMRSADFNFEKIWFGDEAKHFRDTTGAVEQCQGCYHHCFISPAIFRTPAYWLPIGKAAAESYQNNR